MESDRFEARMRELEYFHGLRLVPGAWTVLRLDGRGFTGWVGTRFERPFDARLRDWMIETSRALLDGLGGVYAYTESDEISVLFRPSWDLFDRELEKLVSVSAGLASAAFTHAAGEPAHFDSRAIVCVDEATVVDYFRWRQTDAARCALNGWCYWTLRQRGAGVAEATRELEGKSREWKNELLFRYGINFNEVPLWQRRGVGLYWEEFQKEGFNPKTGKTVLATRRRIKADVELPMKDEYAAFLSELLARASTQPALA